MCTPQFFLLLYFVPIKLSHIQKIFILIKLRKWVKKSHNVYILYTVYTLFTALNIQLHLFLDFVHYNCNEISVLLKCNWVLCFDHSNIFTEAIKAKLFYSSL